MGRDLVGMSFRNVYDEAKLGLTSGKLAKIPGGIYALLFGEVPKTVCHAIEKLLGVGDIYGMGFRRKGKLFGSVTIIMRRGTELRNKSTIETFVNQVSVALHRKWAEERLKKAHDELEIKVKEQTANLLAANEVLQKEIADRKQAEKEKEKMQSQLLQSQRMEAIGALSGGIAHDFGNILTVIQGNTDLAMKRIEETHPLYKYLKQIREVSKEATHFTRQLLLFSRKHPMEITSLNLNSPVDNLLKMLNRLIGEHIAITTELEPGLWTVRADPTSIEQVIMNLVLNAKDAMPKGGKIIIKTENVTLNEEYCKVIPEARPGKFVCLSIGDTGVGMDKEIIEHIFEPFFSTKEPGRGTGLGLAVVYGIAKQHEGWINVYSESGQGSNFKIYLPVSPGKPEDEIKKKKVWNASPKNITKSKIDYKK
jgi:signal transduction histidine kinase